MPPARPAWCRPRSARIASRGPAGRFGQQLQADSFAYTLKLPSIQDPYLALIDYPDDDQRTFTIALIERAANPYAPTVGVASGGVYSLSGRMQPHELFFYPREQEPRLLFQNWYPGQRAAAARIRVYRITSAISRPSAGASGPHVRHVARGADAGDGQLRGHAHRRRLAERGPARRSHGPIVELHRRQSLRADDCRVSDEALAQPAFAELRCGDLDSWARHRTRIRYRKTCCGSSC